VDLGCTGHIDVKDVLVVNNHKTRRVLVSITSPVGFYIKDLNDSSVFVSSRFWQIFVIIFGKEENKTENLLVGSETAARHLVDVRARHEESFLRSALEATRFDHDGVLQLKFGFVDESKPIFSMDECNWWIFLEKILDQLLFAKEPLVLGLCENQRLNSIVLALLDLFCVLRVVKQDFEVRVFLFLQLQFIFIDSLESSDC